MGRITPRTLAVGVVLVLLLQACSSSATQAPSSAASAAPATSATASTGAATAGPSVVPVTVPCSGLNLATPGTITVATYGTGLPDIVINPDGTMGALEGTLFAGLAKDCNLQVKLFQTTFASMILAVQQHKADVATYIYYSAARAKVLYYTYPHWVADKAAVFYRSDFTYTGPQSCTTAGTATGFVWAPLLQSAIGSSATLFPDSATGGTAVLNGQLDCWINGITSVADPPWPNAQGKFKTTLLQPGDFGMPLSALDNQSYNAVACDNKPLANAINAELTNLV
ncbi:MAG: transporter substrate-binding domain-containing protein, partial [Acidimicrobiales bacterium]